MKLDRNINEDGLGKYALLKLRKFQEYRHGTFQQLAKPIADAIAVLEEHGFIDWGLHRSESEFMVVRLKDVYAKPALLAYADAVEKDDQEYAGEIREMASRSGIDSPFCKRPD